VKLELMSYFEKSEIPSQIEWYCLYQSRSYSCAT